MARQLAMSGRIRATSLPIRIWILLVVTVLSFDFGLGQAKKPPAKDGHSITKRSPLLVKNHFIPNYPDSFGFVQCGLQDRAGHLWFGTNADGVYRYDGRSFVNYTRRDGLCNNDVICMLEDRAGNLWLGTRGGLCRYSPTTGLNGKESFTNFLMPNPSGEMNDEFVWSLMQDKAGIIWVGANSGIFVCDPATDPTGNAPIFNSFVISADALNPNHLQLKLIQAMAEDKHGNIWFASGDFPGEGICRYDGKSIIRFEPDGIKSFRSILKSKNGDLIFISKNGPMFRFDGEDFVDFSKAVGLQHAAVNAALEDHKGNLWLGVDRDPSLSGNAGVRCFDGKTWRFWTTQNGLCDNSVFFMLEDRSHNLWFGTRNTGLCRYDGKTFTNFME